jgi:precorrin-3B methylase
MPAARGSLTVVGLGIEVPGHVTQQVLAAMDAADDLLYLVPDPVSAQWIESVVPDARSLHELYQPGRDRSEIYADIVDAILAPLRQGRAVCAAFYGHPGVFVQPSHDAIRRAREEGFEARMLPGISADACLFADLGVDPSASGCQSYEATDLLLYARAIDPAVALLVWQAGAVGNVTYTPDGDTSRVPLLVDHLRKWYAPEHPVVLYEASSYAVCGPRVETVALVDLASAEIWPMTTLYVEPVPAELAPEMVELLGFDAVADDEPVAGAERAAATLPLSS